MVKGKYAQREIKIPTVLLPSALLEQKYHFIIQSPYTSHVPTVDIHFLKPSEVRRYLNYIEIFSTENTRHLSYKDQSVFIMTIYRTSAEFLCSSRWYAQQFDKEISYHPDSNIHLLIVLIISWSWISWILYISSTRKPSYLFCCTARTLTCLMLSWNHIHHTKQTVRRKQRQKHIRG